MRSNLKIFLLYTIWQFTLLANGQAIVRCSTVESFNKNAFLNPTLNTNKQALEIEIQQWLKSNPNNRETSIQAIKTIPVVVHVVYNTNPENISAAQIQTQIAVLNKDFRKLNTDMVPSSHPFFSIAGDANLEFCLASIDPFGNSTNGITRTNTSVTEFSDDDQVKTIATGGADAWDATKYLNIWVCDLGSVLLGYAQFPSSLSTAPETDGVVIGYKYFGTINTVATPFNLGRTTTHEIGHWLGLEHIWADEPDCTADDGVSDTPKQASETTGCPSTTNAFITDACATTNPGKMYQNYMDYTDDDCMSIFTNGQISRMNAVLTLTRASLFTNNICSNTSTVNNNSLNNIKIYPNIISNYLTIEGLPVNVNKNYQIIIYNILGKIIYTTELLRNQTLIELQGLNTGSYLLSLQNDDFYFVQKIMVVK